MRQEESAVRRRDLRGLQGNGREKGRSSKNKISEIARKYKIALLGPNCIGVINSGANLNATFAAEKPLVGNISFLTQSGATGTAMLDWSRNTGVGFSKVVSLGNEAGLTELDFVEYFVTDKSTSALLLYLEKVTDGAKFMALARKITRVKPMVVIKAGRSARGSAAVMSHTGSLAPADAVFTAACRECGVITVESLRGFFNLAKLFQNGIYKPLRRFAILTNGGGPSVVATDLIALSRSLELAELSRATQNALRKVLPPMAAVGNPVDVIGDAGSDRYANALAILTAQKNIDGIVAIVTPQMMTDAEAIADVLLSYRNKKPIIPVLMGGPSMEKGLEKLRASGVANFDFAKDAIEGLDAMFLGAKKPVEFRHSVSRLPTPDVGIKQNPKMMDFPATLKLLSRYGVKIPGTLLRRKVNFLQYSKNSETGRSR